MKDKKILIVIGAATLLIVGAVLTAVFLINTPGKEYIGSWQAQEEEMEFVFSDDKFSIYTQLPGTEAGTDAYADITYTYNTVSKNDDIYTLQEIDIEDVQLKGELFDAFPIDEQEEVISSIIESGNYDKLRIRVVDNDEMFIYNDSTEDQDDGLTVKRDVD